MEEDDIYGWILSKNFERVQNKLRKKVKGHKWRGNSGRGLVDAAVQSGSLKMLQLVCQYEDLNQPDSLGWTPLHSACDRGLLECVKFLVSPNNSGIEANINATSNKNITPLHLASKTGDLGIVRLLLSLGAWCDVRDFRNGFTPRDYALKAGHQAIAKELQDFAEQHRQDRNNTLSVKYDNAVNELATLQIDNGKLKQQSKEDKQKLEQLKSELKENNNKLTALQLENCTIIVEVLDLKNKISKLSDEKDKLEEKLRTLENAVPIPPSKIASLPNSTEIMLYDLAKSISPEHFTELGLRLGISSVCLKQIENDNKQSAKQLYEMLRQFAVTCVSDCGTSQMLSELRDVIERMQLVEALDMLDSWT